MGLLIFEIAVQSGLLSRIDGLFVALLTIAYPTFETSINIIMNTYYVAYMLFMLGILLALRADQRGSIILRGMALFAFWWCFWIPSFIVIYGGFIILLYYLKEGLNFSPRNVFHFVVKHLDYFAVPLLYILIWQTLFQPTEGYNQLTFKASIFYSHIEFVRVFIAQLNESLAAFAVRPFFLLIVFATAVGACWLLVKPVIDRAEPLLSPVYSLVFGAGWLALGIFPYAAVEKLPTLHGWESRHLLLVGFPMAIIFVSLGHLLFRESKLNGYPVRYIMLSMLVMILSASVIGSYVDWQARWVKDRSLLSKLSAMESTEDISVFWVDDTYMLGGEALYYEHEWRAIFDYAWGRPELQTGFAVLHYPFIHRLRRLDAEGADGCQAVLSIRRGSEPLNFDNPLGLVFRYFAFKFAPSNGMDRYLDRLIDVDVRRIIAPQATDCAAQQEFLAEAEGEFAFLEDRRWEVTKYRTDLIAFFERSVDETLPPYRDTAFSYFQMGGYANPQGGALDYFVREGIAAMEDVPECRNEHDLALAEELGFDREYFFLYCVIASQPIEQELFPPIPQ
jgi:hypothetical protein